MGEKCPYPGHEGCKWADYILSSRLTPDAFARLKTVCAYIAKYIMERCAIELQFQVTISQQGGMPISIPIQNIAVSPQNVPKQLDLVVCISPLHLQTNWIRLIQSIEIWRQFGASKMLFYVHSITAELQIVLNLYEAAGVVEQIAWPRFPQNLQTGYLPDHLSYVLGQKNALMDCVLRTAGRARYVALMDSDENIVPRERYSNGTLRSLPSLLDAIVEKSKNVGSFVFKHHMLLFQQTPIDHLMRSDDEDVSLADLHLDRNLRSAIVNQPTSAG